MTRPGQLIAALLFGKNSTNQIQPVSRTQPPASVPTHISQTLFSLVSKCFPLVSECFA